MRDLLSLASISQEVFPCDFQSLLSAVDGEVVTVARIEQGGAPMPGRYLPAAFVGGATTRPEENALLGIPAAESSARRNTHRAAAR